jgi:hypothetical protein
MIRWQAANACDADINGAAKARRSCRQTSCKTKRAAEGDIGGSCQGNKMAETAALVNVVLSNDPKINLS